MTIEEAYALRLHVESQINHLLTSLQEVTRMKVSKVEFRPWSKHKHCYLDNSGVSLTLDMWKDSDP